MRSQTKYLGLVVFSAGILLAATLVSAQTATTNQLMLAGGEGGPHVRMHFGEHFGLDEGKVVKGVPFSAQAVTEHSQTLSDGNHIHVTHNASVFRDSEGRVRREMTITGMAPLAASTTGSKLIMINDVVAGVRYMLNPQTKTANKLPAKHMPGPTAVRDGEGNVFYQKMGPGGSGAPPKPVVEDLGSQVIQGMTVQGTRTTTTIPAGQLGNERPIEIVSERWYSPDLQTAIKFTHSDPWSGETTYQLTNINRGEPDASLFQVPAGYTIREGPPMVTMHDAPPPPDMPSH